FPPTPRYQFPITPCRSDLARNRAACTCPSTISCAPWPNNRGIVPLASSSPAQARTERQALRKFRATAALPSPKTKLQRNITVCPQARSLQAASTISFHQKQSPANLRALPVTPIWRATTPPRLLLSPRRRTPD